MIESGSVRFSKELQEKKSLLSNRDNSGWNGHNAERRAGGKGTIAYVAYGFRNKGRMQIVTSIKSVTIDACGRRRNANGLKKVASCKRIFTNKSGGVWDGVIRISFVTRV